MIRVTKLYVDWQFEQEFEDEKNNAMAWGTSSRNANGEYMNFGKSGNPVKYCRLCA